jgi:hypothetical protein
LSNPLSHTLPLDGGGAGGGESYYFTPPFQITIIGSIPRANYSNDNPFIHEGMNATF